MLGYLILLLTLIPIFELALLIKVGQIIGASNTIAIVLLTGVLGAVMLKYQGISVLRRINDELYIGKLPSDALLDGFLIFCGGLLLITPGIATDVVGFLLLFPYTRELIKFLIKRKILKSINEGRGMRFRYFRHDRF